MTNKTVVVTGSQGFIGGYLCRELLENGYQVIGIDNYSKYGRLKRDYDDHPNFLLEEYDLAHHRTPSFLGNLLKDADYVIAGAAMIGGISYFHKYPYTLLAANERIMANTCDSAITGFKHGKLSRLVVISSSMVFEGADAYDAEMDGIITRYGADCCGVSSHEQVGLSPWPSKEGDVEVFPPPYSTYGFQKLATEYFCKGANQEFGLPYTIVRPFNCVGIGEEESLADPEIYSGNVKLRMSHVLPDLVNKVLGGQDPLHILGDGNQIRCYTHGKDIARGIRLAMESELSVCKAYNISTDRQTTVLELAELVWKEIYGDGKTFRYVSDEPYQYDVQRRIPNVNKARDHFGFEAEIPLEESVREVVSHMRKEQGNV